MYLGSFLIVTAPGAGGKEEATITIQGDDVSGVHREWWKLSRKTLSSHPGGREITFVKVT